MGLFEWVKSKTGVWGPALLDFYFHNSLWINTIIVLYGLVLLLSWQNLGRMRDILINQILQQAGHTPRRLRLSEVHLAWEEALAASKFPFIATATGLTLRRTTLKNIQGLISERDLIHNSARQLKELGIQLDREK
ncbi:MAG: hypothetical protein FJZ87_10370 [Chloroflexi bacterium]|nr:hypothetical protein [Chloroflexota bacterium]